MSKKLFKNLTRAKHIEFMNWAARTHYFSKVKDATSTAPMIMKK